MRRNFRPQFLLGMRVCPEDSLSDVSSYLFVLANVGITHSYANQKSKLRPYWKPYSFGILQ